MTLTTKLILAISPFLILVATAGWGMAGCKVLMPSEARLAHLDIFDSVFVGIFVLTLFVLVVNFFSGLGTSAGVIFAVVGFVFFLAFARSQLLLLRQSFVMILAVAFVMLLNRKMGFHYDAGLYHVSYMNWIAHEPLPLGLANLEGRLGFNSGWLLYVSAFRIESILGWGHVVATEMAIRALALSWLMWRFIQEYRYRWNVTSLLYLSSLLILIIYMWKHMDKATSTDQAANLCAFVAWILYCELHINSAKMEKLMVGLRILLMTLTAVMAVVIKLSMLPILVLPIFAVLRLKNLVFQIHLRQLLPWVTIIIFFILGWLGRNVMLSGCVLYPVPMTCFDFSWASTYHHVAAVSEDITGWARAPGADYRSYVDTWNFSWFGSWAGEFIKTTLFKLLLASILLALFTALLVEKRAQSHGQSALNATTVLIAASGMLLWFVKAPDVRFSWVFFAISSVALIHWTLARHVITVPNLEFRKFNNGTRMVAGVFVALSSLLLVINISQIPLTTSMPAVEEEYSANGWKAVRPVEGDQCWANFPCAPYGASGLVVERIKGRLQFITQQNYE